MRRVAWIPCVALVLAVAGCDGASNDRVSISDAERLLVELTLGDAAHLTHGDLERLVSGISEMSGSDVWGTASVDEELFGVMQRGDFTFMSGRLVQFAFSVEELEQRSAEQLRDRVLAALRSLHGPAEEVERGPVLGMPVSMYVWTEADTRVMLVLAAVPDEGYSVSWGAQFQHSEP